MKLFYVLLALTPLLTQCKSGSESYTAPETYTYESTPYEIPKAKTNLEKALFYCSSDGECPNNVGLIEVKKSTSLGQCTGFLIADDIVATNKHCIPKHIQYPGASCGNNISIRFLAPNQDKQTFKCQSIISVNEEDKVRAVGFDYAFFKIASTNIIPFQISKDSVNNNSTIKTFKVTPTGGGKIGGRLETSICKSNTQNILNIGSPSKWSRVGLALGCETTQGNSGSPIVNERNEVIGILQAYAGEKYRKRLVDSFKEFKLTVPKKIPHHGLYSNMSCIPDPVTNTYNKEQCDFWRDKTIFNCLSSQNKETNESITETITSWGEQLPDIFLYHLITNKRTGMYSAEPFCTKTVNQVDNYDNFVTLDGVFGFRKEKVSVSFDQAIKIGAQFSVNHNYVLDEALEITEEFKGNYTFEVIKNGNTWKGFKKLNSQNILITKSKLDQIKIPFEIPDCTDEDITTAEESPEMHQFAQVGGKLILLSEYKEDAKPKTKKRETLQCWDE